MLSNKFIHNSIFIFVIISFSIIYYFTLFPGVGGRVNFGDSAKFQFLWAINGVPHSTGYPQYTFLTKLFAHYFPFFDPWKKISILSTIFGIATLIVLYKITYLIIKNYLLSYLPLISLGSCYVFWCQSTEPEVYTLNSFYLVSVLYFLIKFYYSNKIKFLYFSILIYAISFGNHLMMITLLPAFCYLIYTVNKKIFIQPKFILIVLLSIVVGISQYYYIWYLSHQESIGLEYVGYNPKFSHFIDYITGGQFRNQLNGNVFFMDSISLLLTHIWQNIGWSILIILIVYFFSSKDYSKRNSKQIQIFILIALFSHIIFTSRYDIGDIVVYYIPILIYISLFLVANLTILDSKKTILVLTFSHVLFGVLFIYRTKDKLEEITLNPMNEIECYSNIIPNKATLFLPHAPFYDYYGAMAVNYVKFVANPKELNIIQGLDLNDLPKEFYIPVKYVQDIPVDQYDIKPIGISKEENIVKFLESNFNKTIIISAKDEAVNGLSEEDKIALEKLGLKKLKNLAIRGSYIAVISNNKIIKEVADDFNKINVSNINSSNNFKINKIVSSGYRVGNYSSIIINNKDYSMNQKGLNIVVIDKNKIQSFYADTNISNIIYPLIYKANIKNEAM